MPARVLAAVSGGVDSAVAAFLLRESGLEVAAATMQLVPCNHSNEIRRSACCCARGIESARRICDHLGIPHSVVDLTEAFEKGVVGYFLDEYSRGRTPNPCVECNRLIKFAALRARAAAFGCERVATGHYARSEPAGPGRFLLKRAIDAAKDQSYFLATLNQEQLGAALFPLGRKTKPQVRRLAARLGISRLVTPESQDICFLEGDMRGFLEKRARGNLAPGAIRDTAGKVLGTHGGVGLYTIGQRRGLRVAAGRALYVVDIIPGENTVVLGTRQEAMCRRFRAQRPNWIAFREPPEKFRAFVKIRYAHPGANGLVTVRGGAVEVEFEEPQFAAAPGQLAVFHEGDVVLGAATIDARCPQAP